MTSLKTIYGTSDNREDRFSQRPRINTEPAHLLDATEAARRAELAARRAQDPGSLYYDPDLSPEEREASTRAAAEALRKLGVQATTVGAQEVSEECPTFSIGDTDRQTRTEREWCPRAVPVMAAQEGVTVTVWPECDSRTCPVCKDRIDSHDAARILWTFEAVGMWLTEMDPEAWSSFTRKVNRRGEYAVKMQSYKDHDRIVVLTSAQLTDDAREIPDDVRESLVVDLTRLRPPGSPLPRVGEKGKKRRPTLSGVGLPSRKDWELMRGLTDPAEDQETISVALHQSVTPEELVTAAEKLDLDTEQPDPYTVRILAEWNDPRLVTLRKWARDPEEFPWEAMRKATEQAQGVLPLEEPPAETYWTDSEAVAV